MRDLDAAERAMGKSRRDAAPILFLDRVLADGEMPGLFAAASHYWSMSKGEGWDLPMVEAAATGLRLIAPRHSAYTAYLDDSVATMLPARPVPALVEGDGATQRLFEGSLWWEPDEDAAVAAIRGVLEGTDDALASPRARVVPALSWTASTARLLEILEEVAGAPPSGHRDRAQGVRR
jgi:glycosyltransferase involved in cell wall biosynthesis